MRSGPEGFVADVPVDLDQQWWHDGAVWRPVESADGHQWFDGQRWRPKRPVFQWLWVASWGVLGLSPLGMMLGFGIVAGHPQYVDQPPVSDDWMLLAFAFYLMAPLGVLGAVVAKWFLGRPGLGERGRVCWIWNPPPGWPAKPRRWSPPPGWEPDPAWPAPPPQWRGWVRQYPRTINW